MSKKNLKLIMELLFIFILPLIFMCFTSEIQVDRNFEYDINGNYEISQETKKLSFDNSIIKYKNNTNYINYLYFNQLHKFEDNNYYELVNDYTITYDNQTLNWQIFTFNCNVNHKYLFIYNYTYDEIPQSNNSYIFYLRYSDTENVDNIYQIGENPTYSFITINDNYYQIRTAIYDTETYSGEFKINCYDLTLMFGEGYEPTTLNDFYNYVNNEYYNYINYEILTYESNNIISSQHKFNYTIWGNIKQIVIDYLDVNDNILLDIFICYLFLWLFMFFIWHTFYRFFDWIFHLSFIGGKDNG